MNLLKISLLFLALFVLTKSFAKTGKNRLSERIGVCTGISNAGMVKAAGGHHLELNLNDFTAPEKDEAAFESQLNRWKGCGLPVCSTNGFFPGDLKVTGPNADHERAVRYTETALRHAQIAGIKVCVLGSSGSRNIPDGFSRQEAEA